MVFHRCSGLQDLQKVSGLPAAYRIHALKTLVKPLSNLKRCIVTSRTARPACSGRCPHTRISTAGLPASKEAPLFLKAGRNPEASQSVQRYDYGYDMVMTKMRVVLAMALLNARMVMRFMMMMMMTEVSRCL